MNTPPKIDLGSIMKKQIGSAETAKEPISEEVIVETPSEIKEEIKETVKVETKELINKESDIKAESEKESTPKLNKISLNSISTNKKEDKTKDTKESVNKNEEKTEENTPKTNKISLNSISTNKKETTDTKKNENKDEIKKEIIEEVSNKDEIKKESNSKLSISSITKNKSTEEKTEKESVDLKETKEEQKDTENIKTPINKDETKKSDGPKIGIKKDDDSSKVNTSKKDEDEENNGVYKLQSVEEIQAKIDDEVDKEAAKKLKIAKKDEDLGELFGNYHSDFESEEDIKAYDEKRKIELEKQRAIDKKDNENLGKDLINQEKKKQIDEEKEAVKKKKTEKRNKVIKKMASILVPIMTIGALTVIFPNNPIMNAIKGLNEVEVEKIWVQETINIMGNSYIVEFKENKDGNKAYKYEEIVYNTREELMNKLNENIVLVAETKKVILKDAIRNIGKRKIEREQKAKEKLEKEKIRNVLLEKYSR